MNTFVWLDLILLALLLVTGLLFLMIETGSLNDAAKPGLMAKDWSASAKRYWLYPARLIRQCGLPVERSRPLYWGLKTLLMILAVMCSVEFLAIRLPLWSYLLLALAAFLLCDGWLLLKRRSRRAEVSQSLLFFVELLIVNLKSGFGLSQAFHNTTEYGLPKETALARETVLIANELDAGRDRRVAFKHLADRTGVKEMERLAAVIDIGFAVGAPVTEALQAQAKMLANQQKQKHTAALNRKSLETLLPMLLICFPMFLVLVFLPAGLQLVEMLDVLKDIL